MPVVDALTSISSFQSRLPAISSARGTVTHGSLVESARSISSELIDRGVLPGDGIAIEFRTSERLPELYLACWLSGAHVIPLDAAHPPARRELAMSLAGAVWVLTPAADAVDVCRIADRPRRPVAPDLAYAMLTSGSTGTPKCVGVTHANLDWLVGRGAATVGSRDIRRWSSIHSPAFDFSIWEFLVPLVNRGTTVVIDRPVVLNPFALSSALHEEEVELFSTTPQLLYVLADVWERHGVPPALRLIVSGGDVLHADRLVDLRKANPELRIVNMYGITETTVHVTSTDIGADDKPATTVGAALDGVSVSVCSPAGRPLPPGVAGEIRVAGAGVSAGYLNDPRHTARSFVPDDSPGAIGRRSYRTGDLARLGADGELEYLGRVDDQLTVRGHRVDPHEVEAAARRAVNITDCCVGLLRSGPGAGRLTLVYTAERTGPPDADLEAGLLTRLREELPAAMVPTVVGRVESLPLTTNGKVDRDAAVAALRAAPIVAEAEAEAEAGPDRADPSPIEEIWCTLLGKRPAGPHVSFFGEGGDSLLAMRLLSGVERVTGVRVPVHDFFDRPTIHTLQALTKDRDV
ncbi:non-ribosomal peptide synthetase [Streptomyces alkaliphilus]|uniref:non-ribosomal peptide synthetase n=1 Tax=Streptomyces alkaliphilus TaxID=1472722 RepID=UPI00117FAF99|nr:non-ribosomal peptide synthetase [Streptomyces alkaliphilus]MQS05661.1 AMP-binding protein [Streptomyces alkaliphilus]